MNGWGEHSCGQCTGRWYDTLVRLNDTPVRFGVFVCTIFVVHSYTCTVYISTFCNVWCSNILYVAKSK